MTHLPNEIINKIIMMTAPKRYEYDSQGGALRFDIRLIADIARFRNYTMLDLINNESHFKKLGKWNHQNGFKLYNVILQINTIAMRIDDTFDNFYEYCKYLNFNDDSDGESEDEDDNYDY